MTTGMYSDRGTLPPRINEKLFMEERFYPGELGGVVLLEIAALLLWALAIYGIVH